MTVEHLPPAANAVEPRPFAGSDHPMRKVTRQVAFDNAWDAARAEKVAALFDSMAATWTEDHGGPDRLGALIDALERGDVPTEGPAVELGSGTGLGTELLRAHQQGVIVAIDIAADMLRHAPPQFGQRVQGDASALPVASGSARIVVLVNALLFPAEVDRILGAGGVVLWVNTNAEQTPIHLPVEDVVAALPGAWTATASRAGTGTWGVVRRA